MRDKLFPLLRGCLGAVLFTMVALTGAIGGCSIVLVLPNASLPTALLLGLFGACAGVFLACRLIWRG
ncbi:MAG: hypothetical protein ACK47B_14930 [Armatimonadota bacterium]